MGTLFPDSDEHPDYRRLASPVPTVYRGVATVTVAAVATFPICPAFPEDRHRDEAPHQQHHPVEPTLTPWAYVASGGSSNSGGADVPLSWMGNTLDSANAVAIRNHVQRRWAAHLAMSSTGPVGTF
jgi:hypothetical protein